MLGDNLEVMLAFIAVPMHVLKRWTPEIASGARRETCLRAIDSILLVQVESARDKVCI